MLEEKAAIPLVAQQLAFIQAVQSADWWECVTVGVTVPMLEGLRRRLRNLVAIHKLRMNRPLTASDLAELERMLIASGIGALPLKPFHRQQPFADGQIGFALVAIRRDGERHSEAEWPNNGRLDQSVVVVPEGVPPGSGTGSPQGDERSP